MENFLKFKNKRGFTLLEILVVVSIIGILIAAGTVSYTSAQKKSRDSRRKEDMKVIQMAAEQYFSVKNQYPTSTTQIGEMIQGGFPQDPKPSPQPQYNCTFTPASGGGYCCCASLEISNSGNANTAGANGVCSFTTGDYYCVQNLQ